MLMVNKRQREVEHVIDTVHSKEVPGVHFCCRQADSKKDYSNNQ